MFIVQDVSIVYRIFIFFCVMFFRVMLETNNFTTSLNLHIFKINMRQEGPLVVVGCKMSKKIVRIFLHTLITSTYKNFFWVYVMALQIYGAICVRMKNGRLRCAPFAKTRFGFMKERTAGRQNVNCSWRPPLKSILDLMNSDLVLVGKVWLKNGQSGTIVQ